MLFPVHCRLCVLRLVLLLFFQHLTPTHNFRKDVVHCSLYVLILDSENNFCSHIYGGTHWYAQLLGRLRQEAYEFEAIQGHLVRSHQRMRWRGTGGRKQGVARMMGTFLAEKASEKYWKATNMSAALTQEKKSETPAIGTKFYRS